MAPRGHTRYLDDGNDGIGDKEKRFTIARLQETVLSVPSRFRSIAPRPPPEPIPTTLQGSASLFVSRPQVPAIPQVSNKPFSSQSLAPASLSSSSSESESESNSESDSEDDDDDDDDGDDEESDGDSEDDEESEDSEDGEQRQPELGLEILVPPLFIHPLGTNPNEINRGGRRKRIGPRKHAEPTGEIKLRLTEASSIFLAQDYLEAINKISEILKTNAETHEAWILLASCWEELGEINKSIYAYLGAAHLRPKYASGWLDVARRFEEVDDTYGADYCYRCCTKFLPRVEDGHRGKARMNIKKRNWLGAITEFTKVYNDKPYDLEVMRGLVQANLNIKKYKVVTDILQRMFTYYKQPNNWRQDMPDWNDLIQLVAAYQIMGDYPAAIKYLGSYARWFLGRADDTYFDDIANDCEWDDDDDDERRLKVSGFAKIDTSIPVYGDALPIKLRVQLGQCRFRLNDRDEALRHFDYLDPGDKTGTGIVEDYPHLYFEVAQQLFKAELWKKALTFYNPLRKIPEEETALLYLQIARCFRATKIHFKAEEFFQKTLEFDNGNIEARVELSEILIENNEHDKANRYIMEADRIKKGPNKRDRQRRRGMKRDIQISTIAATRARLKRAYRPRAFRFPRGSLQDKEQERQDEEALAKEYYETFIDDRDAMRSGDIEAIERWREAAEQLTMDFRSVRPFYPPLGLGSDLPEGHSTAMAYQMAQNQIPFEWRGIKFDDWLDVFLEYALFLARSGDKGESYEVMASAKESSVFQRSPNDMFLIWLVWCVCALFAADENGCYFVAKTFMKDYPLMTDSYRFFTAVQAMCHSPLSWYTGGPSKKYIRRQIVMMDTLVKSSTGPQGDFTDEHLDIPLMMLYGHIMYTSESYDLALDYFNRAHALDPSNAMVAFSISLTYIHLVLNRRTQDQPHILFQGTTFLFHYYNIRKESEHREERQEAHFNVARAYHLLGLTSEALPFYHKVLEEASEGERMGEELACGHAVDAAFNLRSIYWSVGNVELAIAVGERWMVL